MQESPRVFYSEILTESADGRVHGWLEQPNVRGTFDILWTCLATIFICTFTILCLNVPAPTDNARKTSFRRLKWMLLALMGPEIVLTYAAGQWSRARQSVDAFQKDGYTEWSMRHAFFAEMGGFVLRFENDRPIPLNAKQLHWLVTNGHVDYPDVTVAEIWDKSKQDTIAKFISAIQVGYIVLQCVGRALQNLAITTLELNTLAIVVCSLMTSFTWWHKPIDVKTPIPIYTLIPAEQITGGRPWKTTQFDFVDDNGPGFSLNVRPFMGIPSIPPERPIQALPNDRFPTNPYGSQEYLLCLATLIFTAIHVAGWNLSFPTRLEQVLWRTASMLLFGITAAFWLLETMASWKRLGRWDRLLRWVTKSKSKFEIEPESCNDTLGMSTDYSTTKDFPLPWEFWSIIPLAVIYAIARVYLLLEAFIELRNLQASSYLTVNWSSYIPHI